VPVQHSLSNGLPLAQLRPFSKATFTLCVLSWQHHFLPLEFTLFGTLTFNYAMLKCLLEKRGGGPFAMAALLADRSQWQRPQKQYFHRNNWRSYKCPSYQK